MVVVSLPQWQSPLVPLSPFLRVRKMRTKFQDNPKIKQIIKTAKMPAEKIDDLEKPSGFLIPTGSTLFNLALSDDIKGGFDSGKIVNLIGDSSSGKTFLALSCFAEMAHSSVFDEYRFIYDDVEQANKFNISYLFGEKTEKRIEEPPKGHSDLIEDFRDNILTVINDEKPFVYVLDSFDALTSEEELKKVNEQIIAREKGNKISGTYGTEKARGASQLLRMIKANLKKTKSALIIISQTRDNIGISFAEKTRSGGRALKFYSTHEIWTAHIGFIKRRVNDKDRKIGIHSRIKITKNKLTGKIHEINIPILYDYGIDDIRGNIDWLIEEGIWDIKGGIIKSNIFPSLTMEKLIHYVEEHGKENELKNIVKEEWENIQNNLKLNRKRKYL